MPAHSPTWAQSRSRESAAPRPSERPSRRHAALRDCRPVRAFGHRSRSGAAGAGAPAARALGRISRMTKVSGVWPRSRCPTCLPGRGRRLGDSRRGGPVAATARSAACLRGRRPRSRSRTSRTARPTSRSRRCRTPDDVEKAGGRWIATGERDGVEIRVLIVGRVGSHRLCHERASEPAGSVREERR
jgi:hypothetical protein